MQPKSFMKREQTLCLLEESEIRPNDFDTIIDDSLLNTSNLKNMIRTHDSVQISDTSMVEDQSV